MCLCNLFVYRALLLLLFLMKDFFLFLNVKHKKELIFISTQTHQTPFKIISCSLFPCHSLFPCLFFFFTVPISIKTHDMNVHKLIVCYFSRVSLCIFVSLRHRHTQSEILIPFCSIVSFTECLVLYFFFQFIFCTHIIFHTFFV